MSLQNNRMAGESIGEVLLAALHPARREILTYLSSHGRGRFTQLAEATGYDPVYQCGSFYYHLSKLEEAGMVRRERESYTLTEKGRGTNQLIGEAVSMRKKEGDLREALKGDEIVVREFSEGDIPGWVGETAQAKILSKILDKKVTPGLHTIDSDRGKKVKVIGESSKTFRQLMEENANELVHGARTNIRETHAKQLTGQDVEVEGEERFGFAAFTADRMIGLIVGVTASRRPTSIVPVPGTKAITYFNHDRRRGQRYEREDCSKGGHDSSSKALSCVALATA